MEIFKQMVQGGLCCYKYISPSVIKHSYNLRLDIDTFSIDSMSTTVYGAYEQEARG